MSDIVERLRDQGKDTFARQYILGMYKLCDEAATEIERLRAALAATPAVGGEARDKIAAVIGKQYYADFEEDACGCTQCEAEREACRKLADQVIALAQPASPLRGREDLMDVLRTALAFIDTALVADENPTMSKREVVRIIREALAGQPTSPAVGGDQKILADKLDAHAIQYANDYGYAIATDLKNAAAALRAQLASPLRGRDNDDLEDFHEEIRGSVLEAVQVFRKDDQDVGTVHRILAEGARRAALSASPPEQPAAAKGN